MLLILSNLRVLFWFIGAKIGYLRGWDKVQIVLGSTHIVQQLLFSLFPYILMFDFDLILGLFLTFWALMGYFWGSKTVLGSTHVVEQLSLCMFLSNLIFDFFLILWSFLNFGVVKGYFWG